MVDPRLLDYVKKEIARGVSKDNLRAVLIAYKWPEQEVDAALKELENVQPKNPEQDLKESTNEFVMEDPAAEKQPATASPVDAKKFPFLVLVVSLIILVLGGSAFYFAFSFQDESEKTPLSTDQQAKLLALSFCTSYCKEDKCEQFKNPGFSAEGLRDKSCADLKVECSKCA